MYFADQKVLRRFAEWLMANGPSHSATKLMRAVESKSPVIGAHIRTAWNNVTDPSQLRERLEADFSRDEVAAIFQLAGVAPGEVTWDLSPTAIRQRRRSTALDEAAQQYGFKTWRRFETAVINGEVVVRVEQKRHT